MSSAEQTAKSAAQSAKPDESTQDKMIRGGIFTKGVIYLLIGILALISALGGGGSTEGKKGIMGWLMAQSYGPYLLLLVAFGLLFYGIWRIIRAFIQEQDSDDKKSVLKRIALFGGGLIYTALAAYAGYLSIQHLNGGGSGGSGGGSGGGQKQDLFATLLSSTWWQVLIGVFIAILVGRAIYYLYMAFSGKFKEKVDKMTGIGHKSLLIKSGYAGFVARAVTFFIIGYLFVRMLIQHDSSEAGGTGKALDFLQNTGGTIALVAIAFGLACYGFFVELQARYRQIKVSV